MKNFKVVSGLLTIFVLAIVFYFSTVASAIEEKPVAVKSKSEISTTCSKTIQLTSGGKGCLSGSYTYCINGGTAVQVFSNAFTVNLPCGETSTICVMSSNGCIGTASVYVACPCFDGDDVVINLANTGAMCLCAPGS